jgi:hypothetical protein
VVGIESLSVEEDISVLSNGSSGPYDFPFGLINFKLIVKQPGDLAQITVYFSEPAPEDGRWYKYHPIETTWTDFSAHSYFSADRYSVILYLEDGGEGDADGTANSIIVDPSGIGIGATNNTNDTGSSGGSGGGCFISAVAGGQDPSVKQADPSHCVLIITFIVFSLGLFGMAGGLVQLGWKKYKTIQRQIPVNNHSGKNKRQ